MPNTLRGNMSDVIASVRLKIGDVAGSTQVFTDLQIQDALDRYRMVMTLAALAPAPTAASTGVVSWNDYYADFSKRGTYGITLGVMYPQAVKLNPWGDWEAGVILQNASYATLTPTTSDLLTGHWNFATSTLPPIFLSGATYDVHAAAGDLLEEWASIEMLNYDHDYNGGAQKESQKAIALERRAERMYGKRRPVSMRMMRSDVNSNA